jgi:cellulose synthase/poly-beta-1,6-N-acetylglucosamine synthase-like glycosyltransferase
MGLNLLEWHFTTMATFQEIILYFFLFIGIYFEVFILFTYFLHKAQIKADGDCSFERETYPSVTIAIPVWNEEKTVAKTVDSLLAINYPKDKLKITIVDDGSTDTTWQIIQQYSHNPQVEIFHKENGGKHTAVNYAIEHATTDLIGCLDADSFVDKDTLKKLVCKFEDPHTMAVTPAMKIHNPKTIVQLIQSAEYLFGILIKKVMALLGAIHVTPGPFTIFRRSLFQQIGMFRKAHNTEDMEIAFRMQANHLKIENVHNAWVYTTGPNTVKKLYRQRVRWTYGFLQNVRDYKYLFFNKKYGNVGILTLPVGLILIIGVLFSVFFLCYRIASFIVRKFIEIKTVGFLMPHFTFSFFYVSTKIHIILGILVFVLMFTLIINAQRLTNEKVRFSRAVLFYFILYPIISPFWVLKSIYNVVFSRKTTWR